MLGLHSMHGCASGIEKQSACRGGTDIQRKNKWLMYGLILRIWILCHRICTSPLLVVWLYWTLLHAITTFLKSRVHPTYLADGMAVSTIYTAETLLLYSS